MALTERPLAVVTGASAGIGYELAKLCAQNGFDLVVAADQPKIVHAAQDFRCSALMRSRLRQTSRR